MLLCSPCLLIFKILLTSELRDNSIIEGFNHSEPYELFLYALKASETKRQYPKRLKMVLDYFKSINELKESKIEAQCKEVITNTF